MYISGSLGDKHYSVLLCHSCVRT